MTSGGHLGFMQLTWVA